MRLLRFAAIFILITGLLGAGYYWGYKTASMGWESGTRRPVLRVMGMNLDYTEKNGRRFSAFFKPLIEREYERSETLSLEGEFIGIATSGGMRIGRAGKMDVLILYGPEHEATVMSLVPETKVIIRYKQKPIPENPFSYHYYLTDIVRK